jgi:N-acetylated-alpha-linked acidic dipeptidase
LANDVARDVADPETKLSVWKRWQLKSLVDASSDEGRAELRSRADLRIDISGGGSDHAGFQNFLGVAVLNYGFSGEDQGGIYHSVYDDFYWYTHFSDTDFAYGKALAQVAGTTVMRLADADLLPFDFFDQAETIQTYVRGLQSYGVQQQNEIRERNLEIDEGAFTASADPKEKYVPPAKQETPPHLNFAPLQNGADALTRAANQYQKALVQANAKGGAALAAASINDVNRMIIDTERKLTNSEGLPGRSWYKHQIYAPGVYTGYEAKAIPAVREAMEQKQWHVAEQAIASAANALQAEATQVNAAASKLEKAAAGK